MTVSVETRHVVPISGKDSLTTAIVAREMFPKVKFEYVFTDVGTELPETYAWLEAVEKLIGISIVRVGVSLEDLIDRLKILPSHHRRFCTRLGKIEPMKEYFGDDDVVQYVGFRYDEKDRVKGLSWADNIDVRYPLIEAKIDLEGVYKLLSSWGVVPPDLIWGKLLEEVCRIPGFERIINRLNPWEKLGVLSWRSRTNCYFCFYQCLYEWVGLLEHHPNLFAKAEELEVEIGGRANRDTATKNFYWVRGTPLRTIRDRAFWILVSRSQEVRSLLTGMCKSSKRINLLDSTSCGIYCGK